MASYSGNGEDAKNNKQDDECVKNVVKEKSADDMRRDELMKVMRDRSLGKEEKEQRMEEIRQKYGGGAPTNSSRTLNTSNKAGRPPKPAATPPKGHGPSDRPRTNTGGINLRSAKSAFGRQSYEKEQTVKKDIMQAKEEAKPMPKAAPKEKTLDQQRREEMMKVMRDRSMSKEEKEWMMEEIRKKYTSPVKTVEVGARHDFDVSAVTLDYELLSSLGGGLRESITLQTLDIVLSGDEDSASEGSISMFDTEIPLQCAAGVNSSPKKLGLRPSSKRRHSLVKQRVLPKMTDNGHQNSHQINYQYPGSNHAKLKPPPKNDNNTTSLDMRLRGELESIIKDPSLTLEERRLKIEQFIEKYAEYAQAAEGSSYSIESSPRPVKTVEVRATNRCFDDTVSEISLWGF
jgi:hypothetical protein